jgi:hypothetical protein
VPLEHPHDPQPVARERTQRRPQAASIPVHAASVTGHTGRMTSVATDVLADAVSGYASRFHTAVGARHHVASPLGAWLLLALVGAAAPDTLGMQAADAARHARELLDEPHPAVASATAAWTRETPAAAAQWLAGLPAAVERGPVPTQDDADAWARRHTLGMIDRFPLTLDHNVRCVLANALATRISWTHPFTTTGSDAFRSGWRERVRTVLRTPEAGHECAIARHRAAGDVAVHRARAEGLAVTSVVAAPDVPADVVLAAAHDAARGRVQRLPLAEVPLGDGAAWTVTESIGTDDRLHAVLPAWSAMSEHDLRESSFGFACAAAELGRLFGAGGWDAAQAATARYHREGFEAAAVTAVAVRMSFRRPGRRRVAELRFDRPYAVVATATGAGPWAGLPVFSAWVAEPEDP